MAEEGMTTVSKPRFDFPEHLVNALIFETFGDQRYTQDSPIMPEVWVAYVRTPRMPLDVLLTPRSGDSPSHLAGRLAARLSKFEGGMDEDEICARYKIAYSRSSVVANVTFRQLACVIVPMTTWWSTLGKEARDYFALRSQVEQLAAGNVSLADIVVDPSRLLKRSTWDFVRFCALAGFITLAAEYESEIDRTEKGQRGTPAQEATASRTRRVRTLKAQRERQLEELLYDLSHGKTPVASVTAVIDAYQRISNSVMDYEDEWPLRIFMITENREAQLAISESRATIKADAANNVFQIDTRDLTWAVIDGGIDARHPAFLDRIRTQERIQLDTRAFPSETTGHQGPPDLANDEGIDNLATTSAARIDAGVWRADIPIDLMALSRVRETYDFTYLREMLATKKLPPSRPEGVGPLEPIAEYIMTHHQQELEDLRVRTGRRREIDWDIVAPLIRVPHDGNYDRPTIGHGTHVAGILAADWAAKDNPEAIDLIGVCPQIRLYDLRVFRPETGSDEFTVQYALQFVQHLNRNRDLPLIYGVNLSLSMLHKMMSFACGRSPVCDECNDLVRSGVVVVVAAGNDGYKTFKTDKGNYSGYHAASVTDPGNAEDVITVGSTHRSNPHEYGVSYFSSRGPTGDGRRKPDLVAPGEKITAPVANCGVQRMDGTSMAAPHVSGAAALLMARHRELIGEPRRIKEILCRTATDLGREPHFQGAGMVDILRALQSI